MRLKAELFTFPGLTLCTSEIHFVAASFPQPVRPKSAIPLTVTAPRQVVVHDCRVEVGADLCAVASRPRRVGEVCELAVTVVVGAQRVSAARVLRARHVPRLDVHGARSVQQRQVGASAGVIDVD